MCSTSREACIRICVEGASAEFKELARREDKTQSECIHLIRFVKSSSIHLYIFILYYWFPYLDYIETKVKFFVYSKLCLFPCLVGAVTIHCTRFPCFLHGTLKFVANSYTWCFISLLKVKNSFGIHLTSTFVPRQDYTPPLENVPVFFPTY